MNYISKLDHIRFFAASWVILKHFNGNIAPEGLKSVNDLIQLFVFGGSSGVSIFLVLSGFLFTMISDYGNKDIKYLDFIRNRILRIFPLLVFIFFIGITANRAESTPMDILRILTLQLNTGHPVTGFGHDFFPIGPMWTIAVEFQFYLIFPFIILFTHTKGLKYLLGLLSIVVLSKISLIVLKGESVNADLYHSIIGRLDQFIIGMLFAFLYKKLSSIKNKLLPYGVLLLAIVTGSFIFILCKNNEILKMIAFRMSESLFFGAMIIFYLMSVKIPRILDKLFALLGAMSYSMYLTHLIVGSVVISLLSSYLPTNTISFTLLFIFPAIIFVSYMTYSIIEKPFFNLKVKYTKG